MTDRVAIDLKWNLPDSKLAGTPVFQNSKSAAKNLRISKDRKSLIVKKKGWTWTLTPSLVPPK